MFASGAVVGLSVGGIIIKDYGWQATFFTIIPVAIALIIVISRFIHVNEEGLVERKGRQHQKEESDQSYLEKTQEGLEAKDNRGDDSKIRREIRFRKVIDVKGAITLAAAVTSFLLALTYLEIGSSSKTTNGLLPTIVFLIIAAISMVLFVIIERRSTNPLIDFRLLLHKTVLPANLIIMIVGFSMFMVFQTVPILARNPPPLGFGEDAVSTGDIQLPFALILLVFGPTSGFIISKLGSIKPVIAGASITSAGFFGLLMFHSTPLSISANLAILSTGLSLTNVGAMNVTILSTPIQFTGISLGTSMLMRIIGAAVGPALAGMFMQANQSMLKIGGLFQSFPSAESYELIFITATVLSILSVGLAILLRRRAIKLAIPNVA
jgi:MFS family permease